MSEVAVEKYKYSQLTSEAQRKAREWWISCESSEYDSGDVKDDAVTCAAFLGFEINRPAIRWLDHHTSFNGFWYATEIDMAGLLEYAPLDEELKKMCARSMALMLRWPLGAAYLDDEGGSMGVQWAYSAPDEDETNDELDNLIDDLADDLARWIHARIEADYEHATSDEAAIEGIEANEYEFDEDGKRV